MTSQSREIVQGRARLTREYICGDPQREEFINSEKQFKKKLVDVLNGDDINGHDSTWILPAPTTDQEQLKQQARM